MVFVFCLKHYPLLSRYTTLKLNRIVRREDAYFLTMRVLKLAEPLLIAPKRLVIDRTKPLD